MSFGRRGAGTPGRVLRPPTRETALAASPAGSAATLEVDENPAEQVSPAAWNWLKRTGAAMAVVLVALIVLPRLLGGSSVPAPQAASPSMEPAMRLALAGQPAVMTIASDDADMHAAIERARGTLEEFWIRMAAPEPGESRFMVKVALATAKGNAEHLWVAGPQAIADGYVGTLASDPRELPGLRNGASIRFTEAQITDWMYMRHGKMVGNETMRVLVERMPEAEAQRYRGLLE